ncbi:TetR family transcriptional regulator [Streptomyces sp. JV176]|uniref:TetR/AcrR family transcriptional regulator n=1 Tax=Streptomyces sp. JV176 TaxID=858630 RepID=UPI002E79B37A|nr:TetR family transcriptional regulator [Streptomyces sp. JV176]MEE1798083.1 TetR family transcriptional regulator [Streptomyces sp. JV176]
MSLRQQKKLAAWRAIRAAALALFDEQGYEATTIEEISAAANVSRATFFNYFAGKEAVVFDLDPEERTRWLALMDERPQGEPLWDSITAILLGVNENLRDRMPLQRRLKTESPALAQATQSFGKQLVADLQGWVATRVPDESDVKAVLMLNLALAASSTAYQTWPSGESFDDFLERLDTCLRLARPQGD